MAVKIITAHPVAQPDGTTKWFICHGTDCGGPGHNPASDYPAIVIPAKEKASLFVVNIDDPSGAIAFANASSSPANGSDALYVTKGPGKHPGKGNDSDGQIHNIALATPQTLVFNDSNAKQMTLSYALNFVKNGQPIEGIDPDIRNGGGGGGTGQVQTFNALFATVESTALTLVGVAVLILIGVMIGRRT